MADKVTLRRILRLFAISARMDMVYLLRDTKFALLGILGDLVNNLATVSGVFLIAARFGGIGEMNADEVLFMMAYSTLSVGVFTLFGSGNNIFISRIIGRGQLDHMFTQPLPLGVQLVTGGFAPFTGGGNLLVGTVLTVISVSRLRLAVTPLWLAALIAYQAATLAVTVARSYIVSSLAFYAPAEAEEISSVAINDTWVVGTFPLSGMPKALQIPLLTILPEGLMAWFPALCLLGRPPLGLTGLYPVLFALLLSLTAKRIFKRGLRNYVQKGSSRYLPYGFRR
ncbi:MAG: ABC transporter permease [Oscillospiraceae bacterium]|jgi:ABC-2 type transport system permease protein|nr:ABC transporter permease [Oscillospiraceae bacterium]